MRPFLIYNQFFDFETFATAAKHWNLDFMLLERGGFRGTLMQFGDDEVQIADCWLGRSMYQRGEARPDNYTFAIPHSQGTPFTWRKTSCPANGIAVFPEDNELEAVSPAGFHVLTVTVSERYLDQFCQRGGFPEPERFIRRGQISLCEWSKVNQIRTVLEPLCNHLRANPALLNESSLRGSFKLDILLLIVQALLASAEHRVFDDKSRKTKAVMRALDYIAAYPEAPCTLVELCGVTGVSERTLRYGFQDLLSVSPKHYILYRKLHQVRRNLINEEGTCKPIADIANAYGFWHLGQFAADYRKLFGELPSKTRTNALLKLRS